MEIKHEEEEEATFYNWDDYDQYSPLQKLEIRNYLETTKKKTDGKIVSTDGIIPCNRTLTDK